MIEGVQSQPDRIDQPSVATTSNEIVAWYRRNEDGSAKAVSAPQFKHGRSVVTDSETASGQSRIVGWIKRS
jgi:hypothetical protein